jgi:replicative DNA helicase
MTHLDRLLSAERLVAAHAFAGAPVEALVNLFPQEPESVAVQEVLRALQAMPADVTPSLASLIAAGASAGHVQFVLDWQDEAFNVSFDRAEEALLCARTLMTASKVLEAAMGEAKNATLTRNKSAAGEAKNATLTRNKSAAALTMTADALASLVADLESTALDTPSMRDYFNSYVERQREIAERGAASWGVRWMDDHAGQFTPGTMTMLAGLPGHGKSVFELQRRSASACCLFAWRWRGKRLPCGSRR